MVPADSLMGGSQPLDKLQDAPSMFDAFTDIEDPKHKASVELKKFDDKIKNL